MRPLKRIDPEHARDQLFELIEGNRLTLIDACRLMRAVTGMTQAEFAHWVGVAPRTYIDLERGVGNPTIETLNRIGKPFNLEAGLVWKQQTIDLDAYLAEADED